MPVPVPGGRNKALEAADMGGMDGFNEVAVVPTASPCAPLREQHALDPRPLLIPKLPANHAPDGAHGSPHGKHVQ